MGTARSELRGLTLWVPLLDTNEDCCLYEEHHSCQRVLTSRLRLSRHTNSTLLIKMLRLLLRAFLPLLLVACTLTVGVAAQASESSTPSFVIAASPATPTTNPIQSNQDLYKLWNVSADADGKIQAIEVLTLDLPGLVFVTYAPTAKSDATSLVGTVKVFGSTAALLDSVTIVSKQAMKGAKLVVSSSNNSAKPHTVAGTAASVAFTADFLLFEIVVLRKSALKKVITSGWADVVVSDDVLFTKKKSDYSFRGFRALQAIEGPSNNISTQQVERNVASVMTAPRQVNRNWTILRPSSSKSMQSLDIQISGQGFGRVSRVDSDLLPEGSIGTVEVARGEIEVTTSVVSGRDVLRITPKNSFSTSANTSVQINLAPNVDVLDVTTFPSAGSASLNVSKNTDKTFPDDSVTMFVNGTGSLFVLANKSAMYVADFNARAAGPGHIQVQVAEIGSVAGITTGRDFYFAMTDHLPATRFTAVVEASKLCSWSLNGSATAYSRDEDDSFCKVKEVPVKIGGTNVTVAPSEAPVGAKNDAPRGVVTPLFSVALATIAVVSATVL